MTQQYPGAVRVLVDGHRSDDLLHDQYATAAVPTVPARFSSGSGCAAGRRDLQPSCRALQQRLPAQRRHPTLQVCRRQLSAAGIRPKLATVVASGYVSEAVFAQAHAEKLRLVAPVTKDTRAMRDGGDPAGGRPLGNVPETARGQRCLRHHRGRADYRQRGRTVEPVFGQLTTRQHMTRFSRRGIAALISEWHLACAAHNLLKLYAHRRPR